jgi:SAM-dependent methyltransferase
MDLDPLRSSVERYYTRRVSEHGPTAQGVDWNGRESQRIRFAQLLQLAGANTSYGLLDYGCGYGALATELPEGATYVGFDISEAMLAQARALFPDRIFVHDETHLTPTDYVVASGIFNVRLHVPISEWEPYVLSTLDRLHELSSRGFAFNMLTSYSDANRMRDDLYYGDPLKFFDRAKRRYARNVALLHDYGLWEWTLLVRKDQD